MKMTPEQKRVAEQLTSLFENGTIKLQYGYAKNLKDGCGSTAGGLDSAPKRATLP